MIRKEHFYHLSNCFVRDFIFSEIIRLRRPKLRFSRNDVILPDQPTSRNRDANRWLDDNLKTKLKSEGSVQVHGEWKDDNSYAKYLRVTFNAETQENAAVWKLSAAFFRIKTAD